MSRRPRFLPGDRVRLADGLESERTLYGAVIERNAAGLVRVAWDHREPDARGAPWYRPVELVAEPVPRDRAWLRLGDDALERARPYSSVRAAVDAYAETARDLARYEQAISASVHMAPVWGLIDEHPDYRLSMGPRGGIVKERA